MTSVTKRPNGKWRARYRQTDGRERAKHFDRKVDAETWLARQVTRLHDGTWIDPDAGRRTFSEHAEEWQRAQIHHRPSTRAITHYRLERILITFAERPLTAITRSEVQAWVRSIGNELAPSSVEAHYRLLAQVMLAAVEDSKIPSSPCRRVNLPDRSDKKVVIPTADEVAAIVGAASPHGRGTVLVAAGAGLRVSEALGLTKDRVDWLRGVISIDRQLVGSTGGEPRFGPPKTKASNRQVPIPRMLVEELAEHVTRHPSPDLLFRNSRGFPWTRSIHNGEWQDWRRRAGVEGVRFHDLRHFYASSLIAAGQSVKVVQDRLGHSSATTTLDVYGHLWPADEEATREAIAEALAPALRKDDVMPQLGVEWGGR